MNDARRSRHTDEKKKYARAREEHRENVKNEFYNKVWVRCSFFLSCRAHCAVYFCFTLQWTTSFDIVFLLFFFIPCWAMRCNRKLNGAWWIDYVRRAPDWILCERHRAGTTGTEMCARWWRLRMTECTHFLFIAEVIKVSVSLPHRMHYCAFDSCTRSTPHAQRHLMQCNGSNFGAEKPDHFAYGVALGLVPDSDGIMHITFSNKI